MPMTLEEFYKLLGERDVVIYQLQRRVAELEAALKPEVEKDKK